jgi:hypothetical protein
VRVADEALFRGARIVRSAGHIAAHGFRTGKQSGREPNSANIDLFIVDQYTPSQLIMISHNTLAQFWEAYGHISYYRRVDLDALVRCDAPATNQIATNSLCK